MKPPFRRNTLLAALAASFITFLIMAATRPEPHTLLVTPDNAILPSPPLDRIIPEFDVKNMPFQAAVLQLSRQLGTPIRMRSQPIQAVGEDPNAPVTIHLINARAATILDEALRIVDQDEKPPTLGYWKGDDGIEVGTHDDEEAYVVTKVYNVRDILKSFAEQGRDFWQSPSGFVTESTPAIPPGTAPLTFGEAQAALEKLVSDNVAAQTWEFNGGTTGELRSAFGRLVVIQTPRNQEAIEALLFLLAKPESLRPPPQGIMLPDHSLRWPTTQ